MVQIQFHQGEPLGHKKEKPPPVSPPSPPPIRRVTVITKDEDTLRSVQHFLWMVRLYGTVVFQTSATIATTILFMLIPWRVTTPYLRDTLPFWSTLLPCALRCHAYWLERQRRPGTLMLVMVYTTLTTISVSTIGLCFDRTVVIQAYVLSSMLCVWCTGLAWLMAWNMQRRLAILCLLSFMLPILWLFIAVQSWEPYQRIILALTVSFIYGLKIVLIRDTLTVLYRSPSNCYTDGDLLRTAMLLYMDQVIMFLLVVVPMTAPIWYPNYAGALGRTAHWLFHK
ncbi:membrane protein US12 [Human betaherpesvirus 5]|nr:membrane protein US12 [Human betaherpesvirus 5]